MLRSKPKQREQAPPSLRDMLAQAGGYATCRASHWSPAGYTERGTTRPLEHAAVAERPQFFDIVFPALKLEEPE